MKRLSAIALTLALSAPGGAAADTPRQPRTPESAHDALRPEWAADVAPKARELAREQAGGDGGRSHHSVTAPEPAPAPTATPVPTAQPTSVPDLISRYWPGNDAKAIRVASCETGGTFNPRATGKAAERGLMQIHPIHRDRIRAAGFTWDEMYQIDANLRFAWLLFKERGWGPWTCARRLGYA